MPQLSPSRSVAFFLALGALPVGYAALHGAAIVLWPTDAEAVSLFFMTLAPVLATLAALQQGRCMGLRPSDGWSMVALAFLLWALGMAAPVVQALVPGESPLLLHADILLFVLYAVPLTWIAASPLRRRDSLAVQAVDGVLALVFGLLFFALILSITAIDSGASPAQSTRHLIWLFDVENIYLLVCIAVRFWAASGVAERRLFLSLLVFAALYLVIAAFNNHVLALEQPPGAIYEVLLPVPFLVFVAVTLGLSGEGRRPPERRARYVRSASPLVLCLAVLGTGLALARTQYAMGAAGVLIAVAGYGLRNVLREVRHVERHALLSSQHAALEAMTLVDALTGVANRRALDQALDREGRGAIRASQPVGVLLIDIDFFKLLNDTAGHQVGDDSLRQVAQTLQSCLKRPEDLLARYGGEEFVVLLPRTDTSGCAKMAEGLRKAIEMAGLSNPGTPGGRLSVSIGVACAVPAHVGDMQVLLREADEALYRAKRSGRDRVVLAWQADGSTPAPA